MKDTIRRLIVGSALLYGTGQSVALTDYTAESYSVGAATFYRSQDVREEIPFDRPPEENESFEKQFAIIPDRARVVGSESAPKEKSGKGKGGKGRSQVNRRNINW